MTVDYQYYHIRSAYPISKFASFHNPSEDPTSENTLPAHKNDDDISPAINTPTLVPVGNHQMKNATLASSSSESAKSRKNRPKARSSRSALTDLLARRKEAKASSSEQQGGGNLHNFLTQL